MFKAFGKKEAKEDLREKYSYEALKSYVSDDLEHLRKYELDDKREDYRRKSLIKTSKNCGKGDLGAKLSMKDHILNLITKYGINENTIDYAISFKSPKTAEIKFYIILFQYKKSFKYKALGAIIKKYNLDEFRELDDEMVCVITEDDINKIYEYENVYITFEDKLEILVQLLYQDTKGLGVIDEIRDHFCDGLSLGVSGVPYDFVGKLSEMELRNDDFDVSKFKLSYESIWLYFEGKEIYLEFLSFGSQKELERVCRLMYHYKDAPQLTRRDGYGFNHMADLSRIAVFRPPFSEGWCAFIRKFDVDADLNTLISGENSDIIIELLDLIAKAKVKLAITGPQGTGKTTLLVAYIKKMYQNITLRVWEDYFESFLRLKMPRRNIMTIKKTGSINGEKGLDAMKKSNGQATIISEVAEDEVIRYIVKIALAASETVLYTNHSNTPEDLPQYLVTGAVNAGAFTNEDKALDEVLKTLGMDAHLYKSTEGERCIERLVEYVVEDTDDSFDILEIDKIKKLSTTEQKLDILLSLMTKMSITKSNTKKYSAVDIIHYDFENKKYVVVNKLSEKRKKEIMKNLLKKDGERFIQLVNKMEAQIAE